jgi:hypothetical protein
MKFETEMQSISPTDESVACRVIALLALVVCIFPLIGLGLSMGAFLANRKERTWVCVVSTIALGVSVHTTAAMAGLLVLAWLIPDV